MLTGALLAFAWSVAPTAVVAADFYLFFDKCTFLVGYLVHSNESLKTIPGDKHAVSCNRSGQKIRCAFEFTGGADSAAGRNWDDYDVQIDSPPLLIFTNPLATDHYVIDVVARSAVTTVRVLDTGTPTRYAGSKVCQGIYLTESQRQMLAPTLKPKEIPK